jgi:hypothetical protein
MKKLKITPFLMLLPILLILMTWYCFHFGLPEGLLVVVVALIITIFVLLIERLLLINFSLKIISIIETMFIFIVIIGILLHQYF